MGNCEFIIQNAVKFMLQTYGIHMYILLVCLRRYKGTYFSQEVAIKILKPERVNTEMLREFSQEVYIMRYATVDSFTLIHTLIVFIVLTFH